MLYFCDVVIDLPIVIYRRKRTLDVVGIEDVALGDHLSQLNNIDFLLCELRSEYHLLENKREFIVVRLD